MTDNNIDVNIVPVKTGAKRVVVSYYHYSRKDKNHMSSQTDYVLVRLLMMINARSMRRLIIGRYQDTSF